MKKMNAIEKIIVVDRVPEKLFEDEMRRYKMAFAEYAKETYDFVQDMSIPNKAAKDVIYQAMLSPFQYFLEDRIRIKRSMPQKSIITKDIESATVGQKKPEPTWKK